MTTKTLDRKSYELAAHFLFDHPRLNTEAARMMLATIIQKTIEETIEDLKFMHDDLKSRQMEQPK